jgi:NADP-dependent 3-hydroxy acid dehydrogenase YdfG
MLARIVNLLVRLTCNGMGASGSEREQKGRLDIMVNAAGVDHPGTIADGGLTQWRDMFDINVIAMLVGSQVAIRVMRGTRSQGHIVTLVLSRTR